MPDHAKAAARIQTRSFSMGTGGHLSRFCIKNLEGADSGFIGQTLSQTNFGPGGRPLSEEAVAAFAHALIEE